MLLATFCFRGLFAEVFPLNIFAKTWKSRKLEKTGRCNLILTVFFNTENKWVYEGLNVMKGNYRTKINTFNMSDFFTPKHLQQHLAFSEPAAAAPVVWIVSKLTHHLNIKHAPEKVLWAVTFRKRPRVMLAQSCFFHTASTGASSLFRWENKRSLFFWPLQ